MTENFNPGDGQLNKPAEILIAEPVTGGEMPETVRIVMARIQCVEPLQRSATDQSVMWLADRNAQLEQEKDHAWHTYANAQKYYTELEKEQSRLNAQIVELRSRPSPSLPAGGAD